MNKLLYYLAWAFRCKLLGKRIPLTSSLIITDECNLHCRHCTVAHLGYPHLSYDAVCRDIRDLYDLGSRMIVFTGGEPFVWRDHAKHLDNVVDYARELGFFRIVVCTNATAKLNSRADYLWVSVDGIPDDHDAIRGEGSHASVVRNIADSKHPRIYVNFVISTENVERFEAAAEAILAIRNVRGILFHLFTPYLGADRNLLLSDEQRRETLRRLSSFKRRHPFGVVNTFAGLRVLRRNLWTRPLWSSVTMNQGVISPCCCRYGIYDDTVCRAGNCTTAVETHVLERMRPLAMLEWLRFL
jgi:MoaA/NifB/PqqE/SkfB family radical SAM enzyme